MSMLKRVPSANASNPSWPEEQSAQAAHNLDLILQAVLLLGQRLTALETKVAEIHQIGQAVQESLAQQPRKQEAYSPVEVARILDKKPYTVREWCRLKRINARKRPYGRGDADEWEIAHEELERIKAHGLLPIPTKY
jgi:hypothetical protein